MVKKTRKSLIHLKSSVSGKIPTAEQLNYGEIAINYAKDSEAIFFKNSENNVVEVKTNSAVVEELNTKQDKTDNALATTAKTVTGAINEINTKVSNIPTVNDPKVSIKMNGTEKGSFTLNQASAGEVDLGTVITAHQDISGKVDKTLNAKAFEAITIRTTNSAEDKAANVAAIKAYVDNLKTLGVDTTKILSIPVRMDIDTTGNLMYRDIGNYFSLTGMVFGPNDLKIAYVDIGNDGHYSEFLKVYDDEQLKTSRKDLVSAINEVNSLAKKKQDALTSGTNIKTINNQSILGSGNVDISAPIYVVPMVLSTEGYPIPDSSKIDTNKLSVYMKSGYTVIGKPVDSSAPIVSFITGNNGYHYHYFDEKKGMMVIRVYGNNLSQHEIEYNYQFAAPQDSGSTGVCGGVPVPTYDDKEKMLKGDGTWSEVKTIDGESLIGSGDIKIKNNDYYLPVSAFSGQTAVTQDVLDAIADVRDSQGKKHLYIYDESAALGAVAEASVANFFGKLSYYVSWMSYYGDYYNTIWAYKINSGSKEITDVSFRLSSFNGSTASASGRQGMVPAPTTADTESFLCGNGKWEKISGGSSAFNVGPLVDNSTSSGKITEANYNALKQHIQNGDALYYAHSDESETCTSNVSATIVSGGTTAETICLFLDDSMSVSGWDPSKALSSFHTTYTANMGMIYQIKKSDLSADLGGYIYHQPMLQNGVNIKKINGQDLILGTPDMNGKANLEISGTFVLDPNNYKFSELVDAVFANKIIMLKDFLFFSHAYSVIAAPMDGDGSIVTTVAETKDVYCAFIYIGATQGGQVTQVTAIKFTGDNTWTVEPKSAGQLLCTDDYKVDTSMSDTSINPVQNKVIKAYIDGLVGNVAAQLAQI